MTFGDLISEVARTSGVSQKDTRCVVEAFCAGLVDSVRGGSSVRVPGLGVFSRKDRAARVGRNPRDGSRIDIPARSVVHFKQGSAVEL